MKYDNGKSPISLIPPECIEEIAHVFGYGAKKYGENNWRLDLNNTSFSRTYSSIQRHLNAFWKGENVDPESGMTHLAHAATQIMILMIQNTHGKNMDDRWYNNDANSK
jgi:hypothetical protein